MHVPTISEVLEQDVALTSMSPVVNEVCAMLDDDEVYASDIGKKISTDGALSVRLLRLANSPYYRALEPVKSVERAVMVLGLRQTRNLVLASAVIEKFESKNRDTLFARAFWSHASICASFADDLARRINLREEGMFVAGLIHDIGAFVLFSQLPDVMRKISEVRKQSNQQLYVIEQDTLGYDHCAVGGALLARWDFPQLFIEAAGYHHTPRQAPKYKYEVGMVQVADILATSISENHFVEHDPSAMNELMWDDLGLSAEMINDSMYEIDKRVADAPSLL